MVSLVELQRQTLVHDDMNDCFLYLTNDPWLSRRWFAESTSTRLKVHFAILASNLQQYD